jgi:pyrophosphatase PpaX
VPAEEVLFIGDSPYDLQAGRAAGVKTGAATWGPHPLSVLQAEHPNYVFATMREILAACGL